MSLSSEPFHRQASSISSDIVDVEGNESVDIHTDSEPEDSLAVDPSTSHIHEEDSSFDIESDSDADSDTGDYNNPQHQGRSGVLVESSANTPALIFNNTKHTEMERSETIDAQGYGQNNLQVLGRLRGRSLEDDEEDEDEDDFFSLTNGSNHSILPQTPLAASSPTMRSQSPLALGSSVSLPEDPFQRNGSPTPGTGLLNQIPLSEQPPSEGLSIVTMQGLSVDEIPPVPATPAAPVEPLRPKRKKSGVLTLAAKFEQEASGITSPTTPTLTTNPSSSPTTSKISSKVEEFEKVISKKASTATLKGSATLPSSPISQKNAFPNPIAIPKAFEGSSEFPTDLEPVRPLVVRTASESSNPWSKPLLDTLPIFQKEERPLNQESEGDRDIVDTLLDAAELSAGTTALGIMTAPATPATLVAATAENTHKSNTPTHSLSSERSSPSEMSTPGNTGSTEANTSIASSEKEASTADPEITPSDDVSRARAPSVSLQPIEKESSLPEKDDNIIFAVYVVGFHHIRGPEVEYSIGGDGQDHTKLWPNLPFQSLPDGSHSHEENFCYFSLLYDNKNKISPVAVPTRDRLGNVIEEAPAMNNVTTLFGISCNRQLKATDLKERPDDVTRSTVQKSVIVIARKPIFGAIREKLAVITRAYFQQGNFEDRSLIDSLYENLVQMFSTKIDENDLYVGMSLRELVYRLKTKVLVLLKALLLEKKIFFFGNNTETLCASQFALVSLIPNLINNLEDCGSPLLKSYETKLKKPTSLRSSDRTSLLQYMGLPLQIFSEGGMFSAYVPLQQMNELKAPETKYFLVGSTNSLLLSPQNCVADIIVHIDRDNVEINNTGLHSALSLSASDKKWINGVIQSVNDTWDPEDPWRPKGLGFRGSEDYVRQQFEDYIMGLLSSVKYDRFLSRASHSKQRLNLPREIDGNPIRLFNNNWIKEWRTTNNFRIFSKFTDDELFDIVEPRHVASIMFAPPPPAKEPPKTNDTKIEEMANGGSNGGRGAKQMLNFWWNNNSKSSDNVASHAGAPANPDTHPEQATQEPTSHSISPTPSNSSGVSSSQKSNRSFSSWSLWGNASHGSEGPKEESSQQTLAKGFFGRFGKN